MTDLPLAFPYEVWMSDLMGKDKDIHSIQATHRHIVNSVRLDLAEQEFITVDKDL